MEGMQSGITMGLDLLQNRLRHKLYLTVEAIGASEIQAIALKQVRHQYKPRM